MYVSGLIRRTRCAGNGAARDHRLAVAPPSIEMPNVGQVVENPPADVVPCCLVLAPGIAEAENNLHRLYTQTELSYFGLAFALLVGLRLARMTSGSAPASTPSVAATGSASTFGARRRRATVASSSSSTSTPSGSVRSLTWTEWPIVSVGDVDFDVIRDVRRDRPRSRARHHLIEHAAVERERLPDMPMRTIGMFTDDLLAGHQLLEVDVQDLPLERVTLDLADQRPRRLPVDIELDDCALGRDVLEELLELARVDRERLRLAAVAVDDGRDRARRCEACGRRPCRRILACWRKVVLSP